MSTALLLNWTQEGMRGRGHIVRELKVDGTSWAEKESYRGKLSSRSTVTVHVDLRNNLGQIFQSVTTPSSKQL